MLRDFEIQEGIYLVQKGYNLDLHNNYSFKEFSYSVAERSLTLYWKRSEGNWIQSGAPVSLEIKFTEVSEFRFMPRNSELPFTEDDCLNSFGYWVDEEWVNGVIIVDSNQKAEPHWSTAIDFMSGAIMIFQAKAASLVVDKV